MKNTEALELHRFSSVARLGEAYVAGELAEIQVRGILASRQHLTLKGINLLVKDWKATKAFEAEYGPSRKWGA
jgi:hypothetical protein